MKKCKTCDKDFEPKNPKGTFCSISCRQKEYRKRRTENLKAYKEYLAANQSGFGDLKPEAQKEVITVALDKLKHLPKRLAEAPLNAPKTLAELKDRCPKEIIGLDRSIWISEERQKYGI